MNTESITPSRGPKPGTDKAARAASQTPEFGQIRRKAFDMNLSIAKLCERAGVSFGTVCGWKNHFPRTLNAKEQLDAILALSSDASSDSAAGE